MTFRNRAKCKNCGDVIESKHNHDWVACKCFKRTQTDIFDYQEANYREEDKEVSFGDAKIPVPVYNESYVNDPVYNELVQRCRGFFLDGGKGYDGKGSGTRCGGNFEDIIWLTGEDDNA